MLAGGALICATHNAGKLAEVRRMLLPLGVMVRSAPEMGLPVPKETAQDFAGNARLKAEAAVRATGLPSLADDSGLCVDALGGAPGVDAAALLETADGRDPGVGMRRLRDLVLANGTAFPALVRFIAALVLVRPGGDSVLATGVVAGQLVWPPRGASGHGFDPMFQPMGMALTFGECPPAAKDALGHRGRALRALCALCFT
jgi:XTP/dITP diphosphohydrolase